MEKVLGNLTRGVKDIPGSKLVTRLHDAVLGFQQSLTDILGICDRVLRGF